MIVVFFPYILIFTITAIGELIIPFQTKNYNTSIQCYQINNNLTNISDDNTTNFTNILNYDESFFGIVDKNTIDPIIWLFLNSAIDFLTIFILLFIFIKKNNGNDKGCISQILTFSIIILLIIRVALFLCSIIIWTFPLLNSKKVCSDIAITNDKYINFSTILYIINSLTIISILYVPCLLSIPENNKQQKFEKEIGGEKKIHDVKEEPTLKTSNYDEDLDML